MRLDVVVSVHSKKVEAALTLQQTHPTPWSPRALRLNIHRAAGINTFVVIVVS